MSSREADILHICLESQLNCIELFAIMLNEYYIVNTYMTMAMLICVALI